MTLYSKRNLPINYWHTSATLSSYSACAMSSKVPSAVKYGSDGSERRRKRACNVTCAIFAATAMSFLMPSIGV